MGRVVVWFKNDLRLHDNYVVSRAGSLIASGEAKEVRIDIPKGHAHLCSVSTTDLIASVLLSTHEGVQSYKCAEGFPNSL